MKSAAGLQKLLRESRIPPGSREAGRLTDFLGLLEKWNFRINLTASTEWNLIGPLFQEGIWASGLYPPGAKSHLDIGSGAGFPALPLKILAPRIGLDLVESRAKKCVFLETATALLKLEETRVHCARLSQFLGKAGEGRFWDCVSWKALKLSSGDLRLLRGHAHPETQFWIFHGKEPAVEEPEILEREFRLLRQWDFPARRDWHLSVFHVKQ